MKELVSVLTSVDDPELMEGFLFGILTKAEIKEIATRWALVREIEAGTDATGDRAKILLRPVQDNERVPGIEEGEFPVQSA
jgi:hypothetical protein